MTRPDVERTVGDILVVSVACIAIFGWCLFYKYGHFITK